MKEMVHVLPLIILKAVLRWLQNQVTRRGRCAVHEMMPLQVVEETLTRFVH